MPGGESQTIRLRYVNIMKVEKKELFNAEFQLGFGFTVLPRTRDPVYIPPKKMKTKKKWTFPISLMAKWK